MCNPQEQTVFVETRVESRDHFKPGFEALVLLQLFCFFLVKGDLVVSNPLDKFV